MSLKLKGLRLTSKTGFCEKDVWLLGAIITGDSHQKPQRELFFNGKANPFNGTTTQPNILIWKVDWLVATQGW